MVGNISRYVIVYTFSFNYQRAVGYTEEGELWTLEIILGKVFIPLTYTMGVQWDECEKVGQLIGVKTIVNEFVAFQKMGEMDLSVSS